MKSGLSSLVMSAAGAGAGGVVVVSRRPNDLRLSFFLRKK
jgi:hypothetical protein